MDVPTHASAGSFCFVYFHNKERVKVPIGTFGGIPTAKKIPYPAESFVVKVKIVHPISELKVNATYTCLAGMQEFDVRVVEVQALVDPKYGRMNLQQLNSTNHMGYNSKTNSTLKKGFLYQVRILVESGLRLICLEKFQLFPSCGQAFIFGSQRGLLAIARIEEVTHKFSCLDNLPRVFAVPKDQLVDPVSGDQLEDWNICQVDLVSTIDTLCLPCGHVKMCLSCTKKLNRCPFCKIQIVKTRSIQAVEMEDNVNLMEYALCDACQKNRITHAVMDCEHYQCLCQ